MNILLTGNLGYIGPVVVNFFKNQFPHVHIKGLDAGYFKDCVMDKALFEHEVDEQIIGDVRAISEEALVGIDAIVHLAAISNDPMGNEFGELTQQVNYEATARLAKMAKSAGVKRFVFASSCSTYGAGADVCSEASAVAPLTVYARSKVQSEQALEPLADGDFQVTCLRFATACGASPRLRLDLVVNDFVASALTKGKIELLSQGTSWRPMIDVNDMARAFAWGCVRGGEPFLIVNAGASNANYQIRELADIVAKVIGNVSVEIKAGAAPDKRSYQVDFSLYESQAVDFTPQVSMTESVIQLVASLKRAQFDDAHFRESDFVRLVVLKAKNLIF